MFKYSLSALLAIISLIGCGGGEKEEFELQNGIGPIKEKLVLSAEIDTTVAFYGKNIFEAKCSQCHKLDTRYTGPAIRKILDKRTPEYVLNMILNPKEMIEKHPEAKKMLAEYLTAMTYQNVSLEEAKKILEYFRKIKNEKQ